MKNVIKENNNYLNKSVLRCQSHTVFFSPIPLEDLCKDAMLNGFPAQDLVEIISQQVSLDFYRITGGGRIDQTCQQYQSQIEISISSVALTWLAFEFFLLVGC